MSRPPKLALPLPGPLRSITVEIPATWTPHEALAVFELLDDLRDKVWSLYRLQIQAVLRDLYGPANEDDDSSRPIDERSLRLAPSRLPSPVRSANCKPPGDSSHYPMPYPQCQTPARTTKRR